MAELAVVKVKGDRCLDNDGSQLLTLVGNSFILVVVFETRVPIGLVRVFSERAANELQSLTERYEATLDQGGEVLSEDFDESLLEELDEVFGSL